MDLFNKTQLRLDNEATAAGARELIALGVLSPKCYMRALSLIRDEKGWGEFFRKVLLFFGIAYILAGAAFFVSEQWHSLAFFTKMLMMQVLLVGSVIVGNFIGIDKPFGKLCLIASILNTGFCLYLIFIHYPVATHSWILYASWSLLIVPWVICSRSAITWILGLFLANYSAILWSYQVGIPSSLVTWHGFMIILVLANLAILMTVEVLGNLFFRKRKVYLWMTALIVTLTQSLFLAFSFILDSAYWTREVLCFILLSVFLFYFYWRIYPKYQGLAVVASYVCLFFLGLVFNEISYLMDKLAYSVTVFFYLVIFLYGLAIFIAFGLLAMFFIRMRARRDRGLLL